MFSYEDMIVLQNIFSKNRWSITCAESCTGGLVASKITEVPGSSSVFNGSIVTYSNEIKEKELGVKKETMIKYGVVSIEVVREMLIGVLKKFDATFAIAISGVAGPGGGTKAKPVGTVAIGIKGISGVEDIKIYHFNGNRKEIQIQSTNKAFEILSKTIQ